MAILNRSPRSSGVRSARWSRGAILPLLLRCEGLNAAEQLVLDLSGSSFAPFRLILATRCEVSVIDGGGQSMAIRQCCPITSPLMFTSSGLGDEVVEGPRRRLFDEMFADPASWCAQQDRFHRHSWPDYEHLSVCMRRADARTVSHTLIELRRDRARMTYLPQAPDEEGSSATFFLALQSMVMS
jgi:hypothetical protein